MQISKQISLKGALTFWLATLLVCSVLIVWAATPSSTIWISPGVYPGAPSFTVWVEGNNYFAKNANGEIEFSGTNASQIIQASINKLSIAGAHGGIILFRDGTYYCDTTLTVSSDSIWLIGESVSFLAGIGAHLIFPTTINGIQITSTINDFKIANINLRSADGSTGTALYAIGSPHYHIFIDNVFIYKWQKGIRINTTWWGTIQKCAIQYVTEESILLEGDTTAFTISDNSIEQSSNVAISIQGPTSRYNYISHNSIETLTDSTAGIEIYNSKQNVISENMIQAYGDYAIRVYNLGNYWASDNKIQFNQIYGQGDRGIVISGTGGYSDRNKVIGNSLDGTQVGEAIIAISAYYTEISNNHVCSAKSNGIMLSSSWYSSILGNIVYATVGDPSIQVYNSKYCIVTSNDAQDSPSWGIYESGTSDYNVFTSNIAINNSAGGIKKAGANTKVNLCWNGTSWIS